MHLFLVDTVTFINIHNDGTYAKFRNADDSIVLVHYCMECTPSPNIREVFPGPAVELWNMYSNEELLRPLCCEVPTLHLHSIISL